jgi:uncharacterized protein (DUF305 family)
MSDSATLIREEAIASGERTVSPAPPRRNWIPTLILLLLVAAGLAFWATLDRPPGDNSLEAGFARDMMTHHDQAVTMALLARDRTDDATIMATTTDMILTQQNQIGQMLGWLNLWNLPATGAQLPMTWMGHPTSRRMPGMASPEEIAELESLSGVDADIQFLRLMIRHHEAALPMAEYAEANTSIPAVRALARQIKDAQLIEIANMEALLEEKDPDGDA